MTNKLPSQLPVSVRKHIMMKTGVRLPASHLLEHVMPGKRYEVIDTYFRTVVIIDEADQRIHVSNSCFHKYFEDITNLRSN